MMTKTDKFHHVFALVDTQHASIAALHPSLRETKYQETAYYTITHSPLYLDD